MFISGKKTVDMKYINIRIYLIYIDTGCNMEGLAWFSRAKSKICETRKTF